ILATSSQGIDFIAQGPTAVIEITGDHELSTPNRHFSRFHNSVIVARNAGSLIHSLPRYSNTNCASSGAFIFIASALNPSVASSCICSWQSLRCASITKDHGSGSLLLNSNPSRASRPALAFSRLSRSVCWTTEKSRSFGGTVIARARPSAPRLSRREEFTTLSNDANHRDQDDC